jgi:starvation-inducible DNA-binding protein
MPNKIEADFSEQTPHLGIRPEYRKQVCNGLSKLLADSYLLYLKTQNYHWNVTGKMFRPLHTLFEEQYRSLAEAIDEIAERIRVLGEFAPGSFTSFTKLTSIREENGQPSAEEMIYNLAVANESVTSTAREILGICEEAEDDVTAGLLVERMQYHEKNAWMLRSMISTKGH